MSLPSASEKYDNAQTVSVHQLKQIFDGFIRLSSYSDDDLTEIIDVLIRIDDKRLLTDPLLVNHQIYSTFTLMLRDLLTKWHTTNYFTQFESSYLFSSLIKLFFKINFSSPELVEPLTKCLNDIATHRRYLQDENNMNYFSKLVQLYIEKKEIINAIVNCLCSDHYLKMFQQTENVDKFLLLTCPTYFKNYHGRQKEKLSEKIFNTLLTSAPQILTCYSKSMEKSVVHLLYVLNHTFQCCTPSTVFGIAQLIPLVDALLSILDDKSLSLKENPSIIKCSVRLLFSLMNKNEPTLKYVQQREDHFHKSKQPNDDDTHRMPNSLISHDESSDINVNLLRDTSIPVCHQRDQEDNIQMVPIVSTISSEETVNNRQVPSTFSSSIFASNENENKEEMTLIWCDKNIGIHDDKKKTVELLQQVNDYVLICSNLETCLEYIEQIQTEKVFLILSGQTADDIIDKVHDLKQIDSIYIFCMNRSTYEHYLTEHHEKYYKLIGIYTEHEPLLRAIQENIRCLVKQSQATSLFEQDERSMRNLNRELHGFDAFRAFKYVLLKTNYDEQQAKREMLEACRNYYRGNVRELKNIDEFERSYNSNNALYWYTRQTFVYRLVNKALRTEDYEALLTLRFYVIDLCDNLRLKYDDLKQCQEQDGSSTLVSFRGLQLAPPELYNLKYNIGKSIATNGFLSTSRSKNVANTFAKIGTKRLGVETVMLEIHVDTTKLTTPLADIAQYSNSPREEEILFDSGASFVIDSVTYDDLESIWWVKLSSASEEVLTDNIQTLIKNCQQTEMNLLLGVLLIKMEHYRICRKYLESLINCYRNEDENIAKIDDLIGWTYQDEKEYDQSISHYTKAYDRYVSSNRWEDASKAATWIASCYYGKEDKIIARQYTEKAYQILKTKTDLPVNHCQFAAIMFLFGLLVSDNNQTARCYYRKALKIYQNASQMCKCSHHEQKIAQIYENIGIRYRDDENYAEAIVYWQKSEELRSKYVTLWKERKAYAHCLMCICSMYIVTKDDMAKNIYNEKIIQFMDNDLIELFYEDDLNVHKHIIEQKSKNNVSENLLVYELKLLKSLEKASTLNYEKIIDQHLNIGEVYTKTKDYKWAREHYDKAYELCVTNISTNEQQAQCLFHIGYRLISDDTDYAFKFVNESLEIRLSVLKSDDVNIAFSHYHIAALYERLEMFDTNIEHLQKAIDIFEKHLDDEQQYQFNVKELYANCYHFSASIFRKKKEFNKSIEYWITAVNTIERFFSHIPDNYCRLAECYRLNAINYQQISDYESSITFFKKYLETIEKHPEVPPPLKPHDHSNEMSDALFLLANIYQKKTDYDNSIFFCEQLIKSVSDDHDNVPVSYTLIGHCHMNQKHYEKAIENYKQAILHLKRKLTNDEERYAECLMYMGFCYLELGKTQFDNAIECILKAIKLYEQDSTKNKNELGLSHLIYGEILFKKGQYVESIEISNQSLLLQIENNLLIALTYLQLGRCFYRNDNYLEALKHTTLSMEIHKEHCYELNDENSADIYFVMSLCCLRLNNFSEALSYTFKSQEIYEKLNSALDLEKANYHSTLALIYSKQHQLEKSREHCKTALDICKQLITNKDKITGIGSIFEDIGELYMDQKKLRNALKYHKKALKYFKQDYIDDHPKIRRTQTIIEKLSLVELEI